MGLSFLMLFHSSFIKVHECSCRKSKYISQLNGPASSSLICSAQYRHAYGQYKSNTIYKQKDISYFISGCQSMRIYNVFRYLILELRYYLWNIIWYVYWLWLCGSYQKLLLTYSRQERQMIDNLGLCSGVCILGMGISSLVFNQILIAIINPDN